MTSRAALTFFCVSVAYSMGWTAVSSMLATFSWQFGPASFLRLNLAFFVPSLPVLLLQALYDTKLSLRLGLGLATALKMVLGLGSSAVVCSLLPLLMWNEKDLLISVVLIGIGSAVAFSSSYQAVPFFDESSNVALTAGFVGGGPLVLLLQLAGDIGPHASFWQAFWLFETSAVLTLLGLICFLMLVRQHWDHLAECTPTFASEKPLLPLILKASLPVNAKSGSKVVTPPGSPTVATVGHTAPEPGEVWHAGQEPFAEAAELLSKPHAGSPGSSTSAAMKAIWPAAASLFCSMFSSMLIAPFFTYVPSSGLLGDILPQALFAARVLSDIAGRFVPLAPLIQTRPGLLLAGIVRLGITPTFFWYIKSANDCNMLNDAAIVAAVAIFWAVAGYANTAAYVRAAAWSPPGAQERAGGLMAFTFQLACLSSLLCAMAIERAGIE